MILAIMNSAMMPTDGIYSKRTISADEARTVVAEARLHEKPIVSYLGYPNVLRVANELFNANLELSRESVQFVPGDIAICFQLKYRVLSSAEKAANTHGQKLEDYNISLVAYSK